MNSTAPRGISLMEVLISIFIVSVGLLGLAALLPVGSYTITETSKADRSAACGRAAMRDLKVRRMLDPFWSTYAPPPYISRWVDASGNDATGVTVNGQTFAIDPLGLAQASTTLRLGGTDGVPRVTLNPLPVAPMVPMSLAEAQKVFQWRDDLVFDIPTDLTKRPQTPPGVGLTSEGSYSWLVTATPSPSELSLNMYERRQYTVSVAVCYKRAFPAGGEGTATVDFIGIGSGDVKLTVPDVASPPQQTITSLRCLRELRQDHWILLCGKVPQGGVAKNLWPAMGRWYRVVALGEVEYDAAHKLYVRHASLEGPDWNDLWYERDATSLAPIDVDGDTILQDATAVIVQTVVGVYTTTTELDRDALWTP